MGGYDKLTIYKMVLQIILTTDLMCNARSILFINMGVWQQFYMIYMSYSDKYMYDMMVIGIEKVNL